MAGLRLERIELLSDGTEAHEISLIPPDEVKGFGMGRVKLSMPSPNSLTSEKVVAVVYETHGQVLAGKGVSMRRVSDHRVVPEGTRFMPRSRWVATGREPDRVQVIISWAEDGKDNP